MDISIVIPAFNEENNIGRLLKSLNNQSTKKEYEIILVDNGSNDNTVTIATQYGAKVLYKERGCNISAIRNLGARCANGRVLVLRPKSSDMFSGCLCFVKLRTTMNPN